ncbi:MAG: phosphatase PAP2 family protein [Rhizomicrobium sp.]|jgi:membrane-associated phospholipid phosphatase
MDHALDLSMRRILSISVESIRRTWINHVPLYTCTLLFTLSTVAVALKYNQSFPWGAGLFFLGTVGELILLAGAVAALHRLLTLYRNGRPENPLTIMVNRLITSAVAGDRVGNIFHGLLNLTPLMMMFAALKTYIARIHPFAWDQIFMHLGSTVGFGRPFWQLLQPALGYPPITTILSFAYGAWFPVMFGCLFWQLTREQSDRTRDQYLLAFALAWFFVGFVIATIFSSAGPCFYGHFVHGSNPYEPLLHYLRQTREHWPVWTVDAQDELWQAYLTGVGDIQGISAMPSMHVTIATLMMLLARRSNPLLGKALTVFAVLIALSAIMLGWHYAVDVFAGAGLAILFWHLSGRICATWEQYCTREAVRQGELATVAL